MLEPLVEQLKEYGIKSTSVLGALNTVQYHLFHDKERIQQNFSDDALPADHGVDIATIFQVAKITEAMIGTNVDLIPKKVLEIGTGTGFQTAVLAEVIEHVYSIERVYSVYELARDRLDGLGVVNARLRFGDGYLGWVDRSPFEGIVVNAVVKEIPSALKEQLSDGGRLVIPVGTPENPVIHLLTREGDRFNQVMIGTGSFSPMLTGTDR